MLMRRFYCAADSITCARNFRSQRCVFKGFFTLNIKMQQSKEMVPLVTAGARRGRGRQTSYGTCPNALSSREETCSRVHEVVKEDTLSSLAVKYNVGVGEIKRLNNLHSDSDLILKTTLRIPKEVEKNKNGDSKENTPTNRPNLTPDGGGCKPDKAPSSEKTADNTDNTSTAKDFFKSFDARAAANSATAKDTMQRVGQIHPEPIVELDFRDSDF